MILLNHPTTSFIRNGASKVIKIGIVWNKVVMRLRSMNCRAAKRHPKEPSPVIVLMANPDLDTITNVSFFRWEKPVINKRGTQNKYLKNKIINTDKFGDINFTKLAIVIVQITSVIDKEIPKTVFELLKFANIHNQSLKKLINS